MKHLKKLGKYIVGFSLIVIVVLTIWSSGACHNESRHKARQTSGKIVEKYIDSENHNTYTLRLENQTVYRIMGFGSELGSLKMIYDSIKVDDFLIKEKGSLDLVIFRDDQRMVFTHDTGCDENWWKFWEKLKF